jgi:hypothetical protein
MIVINLVAPEAADRRELLFNKPALNLVDVNDNEKVL